MSQIIVTFVKEWVDQQRAKGVRVIRQLEKWLASVKDVSLKSSSGNSLTVEVQKSGRERFLKEFAMHMKEDFGEPEPWAHATFAGDLAGLDLPQGGGEAMTQKSESPKSDPSDNPKFGKIDETAAPPVNPSMRFHGFAYIKNFDKRCING